MKNSDKSIFPFKVNRTLETEAAVKIYSSGLTKREYFASMAMQGLLSGNAIDEKFSSGVDTVAKFAIEYTDELLKQLEAPVEIKEEPKRATELVKGCVVFMKSSSGMKGYGNAQCVSSVCEPLGEVGFYGHNEHYKTYDIDRIIEYPIIESLKSDGKKV